MRFLFYQIPPPLWSGSRWLYNRAHRAQKPTGSFFSMIVLTPRPPKFIGGSLISKIKKGQNMKRLYLITCTITCIFIGTVCHADDTTQYNCCDACRNAATALGQTAWLSKPNHPNECIDNYGNQITESAAFTNQDGCAVGRCTEIPLGFRLLCRDCVNFAPPTKDSCYIRNNTYLIPRSTCGATYYACQKGYYGSPSSTVYCKPCPANATCESKDGTKGTKTFTCNKGYAKNAYDPNATSCVKCPDNSECGDGTTVFKCKQYYYLTDDGTDCKKCPSPGITSGDSRSKITDCYIYKINNEKRWYDASGYFNVTGNCEYETDKTPTYPVIGVGTPK